MPSLPAFDAAHPIWCVLDILQKTAEKLLQTLAVHFIIFLGVMENFIKLFLDSHSLIRTLVQSLVSYFILFYFSKWSEKTF